MKYSLFALLPCVASMVARAGEPVEIGSRRELFVDRFLLRTDGFASVSAPWSGGEMFTKLLTFSGNTLSLNYSTSAAGSIRVEIQDPAGRPLPGFSVDDCPEIIGDEIDRTVRWKRGSDVGELAGTPVRLRFVLRDADLFSLKFSTTHWRFHVRSGNSQPTARRPASIRYACLQLD